MSRTGGTISVRMIPAVLGNSEQMTLYRDLESCIEVERPKVVLDCSKLARLEVDSIRLLLCCLEEAIRRNGDVRLAGLQPRAHALLKSTGLDLIFQTFESVDEAVESFRMQNIASAPKYATEETEDQVQTSAA